MNNKFLAIPYRQGSQDFYSVVLPFNIIYKHSHVLIYGKEDYGYQRDEIKEHYLGIKNYLLHPDKDHVLPSSIILGCNRDELTNHIRSDSVGNFYLEIDGGDTHLFRIVDGQHRIKGLAAASEIDDSFNKYMLNVIILVTEPIKRSTELNIFTDINSKSKRIRVDLAELARHNYELLENKVDDLAQHTAIKSAYYIKEDVPPNVWHKAIKFDIHAEVVLGVIGVSAFTQSIYDICQYFIDQRVSGELDAHDAISTTELIAKEVSNYLSAAWKIVENKWSKCFIEQIEMSSDGTPVKIFYNKDFYLQKNLGVRSINWILTDLVKERGATDALTEFKLIIEGSRVKSEDWALGKLFSGLSSESGFRKAKEIIKSYKEYESKQLSIFN